MNDGRERAGSSLWVVRGTSDTSVAQLRLAHGRTGWTASWTGLLTDPALDVPSIATFTVGARVGRRRPFRQRLADHG